MNQITQDEAMEEIRAIYARIRAEKYPMATADYFLRRSVPFLLRRIEKLEEEVRQFRGEDE